MDDMTFSDQMKIDDFSKEELYKLAYYEDVTHYYNWNYMIDKLKNYKKYGVDEFALVHFDVKDFKMVNEIYGHDAGDNLLRKICRLMSEQEWVYFSCRCDNDNFAMMIRRDSDDIIRENLLDMFKKLKKLDEDEKYPVFFRCGVASIDNLGSYGTNATDLAKMAQHLGERVNVTEVCFYNDDMKTETLRGKMLKSDFNRAMREGEYIVYYQPKYNPETEELVGAEALIRWYYHKEKILSPAAFVPYFEKEQMIGKIDLFVLEEVCKKLEEWKHKGIKLVPISVNFSRDELFSPIFLDKIANIVNKYDVDRKYIDFEITETMAYGDLDNMISVMNELKKMGFKLSMDDFGTGYSSLSLLNKMPLTTLKIDKSFIDEIRDERDASIVRFIIEMSKNMKVICVAEGVETESQKNVLRDWGCDCIQGYYYSKPLPVVDFEKLL